MAYLPKFNLGDDTILIGADDTQDVEELMALLRPLTVPDAPSVELHRRLAMGPMRPVRLTAYLDDADDGIRQRPKQAGVPVFDWLRSREGWLDVLAKLETLVASEAGHHFLDNFAETDDAVVMVSKGEYPNDWWRWHA